MIILKILAGYVLFGFFLYHTAFWLYRKLMPQLDSFKSYGYARKAMIAIGMVIGYIEDVLFNLFYATPIHYIVNRRDGFRTTLGYHWPSFNGVTWKNTKQLTLTYRIQQVILDKPKDSDEYRLAHKLALKLNKYDPGHIRGLS